MNYIKLYWKLVKANRTSLIIYSTIFIGVFIAYAALLGDSNQITSFQDVKPDIVLVDHDQSDASKALSEYISGVAKIQEVGEGQKDREDALFYGYVSNIIEIPKGFESDLLDGADTNIKCTSRPDEQNASMLEMKIKSYLSTFKIYQNADSTLSVKQLHAQTMKKVSSSLHITMDINEEVGISQKLKASFYNYLSYILMALILLTVGMTMTTIFKSNIEKRNLMAPISSSKRNLFLLISNIMFGLVLWLIFTIVIFFLPGSEMLSIEGLLYLLNSFVFTMLCVSLGFMFSCLLSNKRHASEALNGIVNVVSLGGAFLGGAFVPQSMISSSILKISSFLPTFWYVKVNDTIASIHDLTMNEYKEIFSYIGIEALFLMTFVCIALLIMKNRKSQDSFLTVQEQSE